MLDIAGQTAGSNGLKNFGISFSKIEFFSYLKFVIFHGQRRALQLVLHNHEFHPICVLSTLFAIKWELYQFEKMPYA